MIRHVAYVISVPHHELPYGDLLTRVFEAFNVPLDDKEGEDPVKTDILEETFLNMCQLKREQGVWWLGIRANKRRDEVENDEGNPAENVEVENEGVNQKDNEEPDFIWEQVEEVVPKNVNVGPEAQVQEEIKEITAEDEDSGTRDKYFDVVDEERSGDVDVTAPAVQTSVQQKGKTKAAGVVTSGHLPDLELIHLQAEFARALQANTRF
ncbi:hypothetical protein Dimus_030840 [Dionaea muscipula]